MENTLDPVLLEDSYIIYYPTLSYRDFLVSILIVLAAELWRDE